MITKDRKEIQSHYRQIVDQVQKNRPFLVDLLRLADSYAKQTAQLAQLGRVLGEQFHRLGTSQSSPDINEVFSKYGVAFGKAEEKRDIYAQYLNSELVNPLRNMLSNDKKCFEDILKQNVSREKTSAAAVKKAEEHSKKVSKSKDIAVLQAALRETNDRVKESEGVLRDNLRDVLEFQRGKYCEIAEHLTILLTPLSVVAQEEISLTEVMKKGLANLGIAKKKLPDNINTLTTPKVRTLNSLHITSDWKKIFQAAGVKKSDFKDEETAALIIETIEKATGQKIVVPEEELYSYQENDEEKEEEEDKEKEEKIQSPTIEKKSHRSNKKSHAKSKQESETEVPPPLPTRPNISASKSASENLNLKKVDSNLEISNENAETDSADIPVAPPAPEAPTAPNAPTAPTAPKIQIQPSKKNDLLDEIHKGTSLRKVEKTELPKVETEEKGNDIASLLRTALSARRVAVVDEQQDDDDDWSS